jgi:hypothetical protein
MIAAGNAVTRMLEYAGLIYETEQVAVVRRR